MTRSDSGDNPRAPPRKRRRIVISCTDCHRRKQKCDRNLPCGNCVSRNKAESCCYETGAPTAQAAQKQQQQQAKTPVPAKEAQDAVVSQPLTSMAADWGYAGNGASTMGFLRKIEGDDVHGNGAQTAGEDDFVMREKYKGLIRQLPAKIYIDKLIDMYMRGLNWQYYSIDEDVFYEQLEKWNNLSFRVLSTAGPQGLSPELRAFPAVLFQVIGHALLLLPEGPDPVFDALKYAGNMKFEDLGTDYSDSGAAVVELLGKKHLSLETVQAQFLRASFQKHTAKVTEAWHTIAIAIRDAQDLGMHRDSLDPKPVDSSLESILENQWLIQRRRKMYYLLAIWDLNCALVLGRPGTIDWNQRLPTPCVDAPLPRDRRKTAIVPRDEDKDHPTPVTRVIWNTQLCYMLKAIQDLENDGPYPKDFSRVDAVQQKIMELDERVPPAFRLDNPDTRWDDHPEMTWVQAARYYFAQLHQFSLMALHRPYVFYRRESRLEGIQASLRMLEIQKMTFQGLPPDSWRNFMLFYGSFDAIVLVASVYILFPGENPELMGSVLQHFQWTIERFSAIQDRNPLARSAQGVLRVIVSRFKQAIAHHAAPSSTEGRSSATPQSDARSGTTATPASSLGSGDLYTYPQPSMTTEWTMPLGDSLTGLAPMFPTGDLIYNELSVVADNAMMMPTMGATDTGADTGLDLESGDLSWQFGGALGDDTVWQLLNQIQPNGGSGA